jgi:hypothetical protein
VTRFKLVRLLAAGIGVSILVASCSSTCECPALSIDQRDAVGTFISLSKDPFNAEIPPEVEPARIRAKRGEQIVWIFRNPSPTDVTIWLSLVKRPNGSTDMKGDLFSSLGLPPVKVPGNCGYGWIKARLRSSTKAHPDSCPRETFNYYFSVRAGTDSIPLAIDPDPELVVEGEP